MRRIESGKGNCVSGSDGFFYDVMLAPLGFRPMKRGLPNYFWRSPKPWVKAACTGLFASVLLLTAGEPFREIQRFKSADAHQGVGVGPERVYAIGSRSITAHDRLTGMPLTRWKAPLLSEWIHLDSGFVKDGKLYCAHSNYPLLPMTGSVEVFDAKTLHWEERHVFEKVPGSCTWVVWHENAWWACFAHYSGLGGYPDKDPSWTTLVRYSEDWKEERRWRFPKEVLERFGRYSCSGGSWGPDGLLYCTGHDAAEVYVLSVSDTEEILELKRIQPINCLGQGIAWDVESAPNATLYTIKRKTREIIVNVLGE